MSAYFNFRHVFFILFMMLCISSIGQESHDFVNIIKQAQDIYYNQPDSALTILDVNKELIIANGSASEKLDMYLTYFRVNYYVKKNLQESKKSLQQAEKVSLANDNLKLSVIYQNFGRYYHRAETQLDSALYYQLLAIETEKKQNKKSYKLHYLYNDIADLYITIKDLVKAQFYIEKALEIVRNSDNRKDYGYTLYNAVKIYEMAETTDKLEATQKEYEEFKSKGQSSSEAAHKNTSFKPDLKNKQEAFLIEINKNDSTKNTTRSLSYRLNLAYEYLSNNKDADAINVLLSGIPMLSDSSILFRQNFHTALKQAYFNSRQFDKAYEQAEIVANLNEKLLNYQKIATIEELQAKYEKLEKEKMISDLQKDKALTTRTNFVLILFLLLATLILAAISGLYILRQKSIRQLREKNSIITDMLKEKDFLIKEIHHRVKNNLQVISSLLQLQARYIQEPLAKAALTEGDSRVRSMAIIHQHLYSGSQLNKIRLIDYIDNLLNNIRASYEQNSANVQLIKNIENIELDIADMIPLGLIINELVVNSYKYAFQSRDEGKIEVKVIHADNKIKVIYSDDGIGMNTIENSKGFGTRLIQSFVKKLNAKYAVNSEPGKGINVIIEFIPTDVQKLLNHVA